MDAFVQDLRYAIRSLLKSPLASGLAVACLALGIGANATMFSVVDMAVLRPLPFPEPDRLVDAWSRQPQDDDPNPVSYLDYQDWRERSQAFVTMAGVEARSLTFSDTDEPERVLGAAVSAPLFSMLGIVPRLGRDFVAADDAPGAVDVVILSDELWRRRYNADPGVVGRAVAVNGRPHSVIGVLPPRVKFPFNQVAWVPLAPLARGEGRAARDLQVVARLKPGVTIEAANDDLNGVARQLAETYPENKDWGVIVRPLSEFFIPGDVKLVTLAAMGAVTLVLLIACANVANLLLARATVRTREIAIRCALGAGRGRVVRQLLTESVVLGLASAPLGVLIARIGIALLDASVPFDDIPYLIEWRLDQKTLFYTIAVSAATGIVFGLAPALQASRTNLLDVLREGGRTGAGAGRNVARNALIVAEVALSLVLLVGASLFMRSFLNIQVADAGFEARPLLSLRFFMPGDAYADDGAKARRVADIVRRVEALPGVEAAASSNLIPLDGGGGLDRVEIEGQPREAGREPQLFYAGVTPRFFDTLGLPVVRGRGFTAIEGETRSAVAIVNVSMARHFFGGDAAGEAQGGASGARAGAARPRDRDRETRLRTAADLGAIDPVGRRFRLLGQRHDTWFTIVGVVPDVMLDEISDTEVVPAAFVAYSYQETPNTGLIVRTTQDPASLSAAVRAAIRASDPTLPVFSVRSMEELRRLGFWQFQLFGWMFSIFGALALLLASVGVYGVLSYAVTQRTHEFGLRMALGARQGDVLSLMIGQGLRLALAGVALGVVGALLVTRVIGSLLYNVTPTDPVSFGVVVVFLLGIATLASYLPARRATRVDPVVALRAD